MKELSHGSLLQDKKGKLINLSDDYCMKEYLTTDKISLEQKQILFNLRTRMVTVRSNNKNKYKGNISCTLCDTGLEESQEHLLQCPALLEKVEVDSSIKYMDILPQSNQQHKTKQNNLAGVVLLSVKIPPPHHTTTPGMITV